MASAMSWMELFETLINNFLSLTNVARSFVLEIARVLDLTLEIKMKTIHLFNFMFSFVDELYVLLNLS